MADDRLTGSITLGGSSAALAADWTASGCNERARKRDSPTSGATKRARTKASGLAAPESKTDRQHFLNL